MCLIQCPVCTHQVSILSAFSFCEQVSTSRSSDSHQLKNMLYVSVTWHNVSIYSVWAAELDPQCYCLFLHDVWCIVTYDIIKDLTVSDCLFLNYFQDK